MPLVTHSCVPACGKGSCAGDSSVAEQAFQRLDPAPLRRPAQTAGAKSGPVIHFLSPLQAVETEFRSSAPACDKTNYQKSGTRSRQESHDEPKVQRTQSMTGKSCNPTRLTAGGYGGQSGSAYRRSGRHFPAIDPCDGSSAAPARILPRKNVGAAPCFPLRALYANPLLCWKPNRSSVSGAGGCSANTVAFFGSGARTPLQSTVRTLRTFCSSRSDFALATSRSWVRRGCAGLADFA